MNKKILIGAVGIVLVSVAVYLAVLLTGNGPGAASAQPRYEVVLPPEWPTRPSDLEGLAVEVKDNRLFVKPVFKRQTGQEDYPAVEVVVTNTTAIYRDATDRQHPVVVDGKFHWVLNPFDLTQVQAGYVVNVWGAQRGDRWIAETVIIYVVPMGDESTQ